MHFLTKPEENTYFIDGENDFDLIINSSNNKKTYFKLRANYGKGDFINKVDVYLFDRLIVSGIIQEGLEKIADKSHPIKINIEGQTLKLYFYSNFFGHNLTWFDYFLVYETPSDERHQEPKYFSINFMGQGSNNHSKEYFYNPNEEYFAKIQF